MINLPYSVLFGGKLVRYQSFWFLLYLLESYFVPILVGYHWSNASTIKVKALSSEHIEQVT